jgi:hypothetical protein
MIPFKQFAINEKAPPSAKAEKWIKDNKDRFKDQYGDDWEQVLYATAWKMFGKKEGIDERVWYDTIIAKMSRNVLHIGDYKLALKDLVKVIKRKGESGNLRHDINYYASRIASSYTNVDGRELADMFNDTFPQGV